MEHGPGVAVVVEHEVVGGEIADDLVGVEAALEVGALGEGLERGDYAPLVLLVDLGLRVVEDVGIAFEVVIGVDKVGALGAATEAHEIHAAAEAAEILAVAKTTEVLGHLSVLRGLHALGRLHVAETLKALRSLHAAETLESLRSLHALGSCEPALRATSLRHASALLAATEAARECAGHLSTTEAAAGLAASLIHVAEHLGLRLVELALSILRALEERRAHILDGDVEAEILAVHREPREARERCGHAELPEQLVAQVVLEVGGIGVDVVEVELVEAVEGLIVHVLAEVQLEAIAVALGIGGHEREACVALGRKGDVAQGLTVDGRVDMVFGLVSGI